jgi:hypothetical protein
MANLLQVSSAFGRAMESVNRTAMVKALYPTLLAQHQQLRVTAGTREERGEEEEGSRALTALLDLGLALALDVTALPPTPLATVIASSAEGYAFPSNLDKVPPAFNFEHASQASLLTKCLMEEKSMAEFAEEIDVYNAKRV